MNNQWGMHLGNGELANDAVFSMGFSHYMMLHLQAPDLAYRARQASPSGVIEIRFYCVNWWAYEPEIWAEYCAQEYVKARSYEGQLYSYVSLQCDVTPANEQNLSVEGGGWTRLWYERINDWNRRWKKRFQQLTGCPTERIHWPAFAYGKNDDMYGPDADATKPDYCGMEICREGIEEYGPLDVHPYWFKPEQVTDPYYGHRYELAHERFPNKLIFCSELGNFNITRPSTAEEFIRWFESLPAYVIGGTPFIWEDPTGQHVSNDWSRNPALIERIGNHPKREIEIHTEEGMPVPFQFAFGFKDLHDANPDVVGEATSEQIDIPNVMSVQFTDKGLLIYRDGTGVKFIAQTLPK